MNMPLFTDDSLYICFKSCVLCHRASSFHPSLKTIASGTASLIAFLPEKLDVIAMKQTSFKVDLVLKYSLPLSVKCSGHGDVE